MTQSAELFEIETPDEIVAVTAVGFTAESVRSQLRRILESKTFQRATRLRSLLEYVVEGSLNGNHGGQMRTARELFGKDQDFDPSLDPVIRVQFGRLRRTLDHYYEVEGKNDPVVIKVPNRRYTPEFRVPVAAVEDECIGTGRLMEETFGSGKQPAGGTAASAADETRNGRRVIAVMPFSNLTAEAAHDAFCYGLTEEIANGLASYESVDIVASSSTFQFKDQHFDVREVGRELGAPFVLEGTVRIDEGHTRVIAQLVRAADGVAIWSESFEEPMNGSFHTQSTIAQRVMENLPLTDQEG